MDIIGKETEILERLKENGYSKFGGDKNAALDYVSDQLEKVLMYDTAMVGERIKKHLSGGESGAKDARETAEYERQASGLKALNKLCEELGLEPFTDVDTEDHVAVAAFVGQCRRDLYNRGIGKSDKS